METDRRRSGAAGVGVRHETEKAVTETNLSIWKREKQQQGLKSGMSGSAMTQHL